MQRSPKKDPAVSADPLDFAAIAEQSLAAQVVVSGGQIVYCNGAFESMTGFSGEDLAGLGTGAFTRLVERGSLALFEQLMQLCLDHGQVAYHPEIGLVRKDGSQGWIEITVNPIDYRGVGAVHCSCVDRTELRRQRETANRANQTHRALLDAVPFPAMTLDPQGIVTFCNERMTDCTGWTREEFVGNSFFNRCMPEGDRQQGMREAMALAPDHFGAECGILTRTGERKTLFISGAVERDARGLPAAFLCIGEELTERRRTETVMRENQEKFVSMIEQTGDGIAITDEEGCVIAWNRALETISGLSREEVLGKFQWDILHRMTCDEERTDESYGRNRLNHEELLSSGLLKNATPAIKRLQRSDGTRKIVRLEMIVMHTSRGHRIGTVVTDITELFAAKDALRESELRYQCLAETVPDIIFVIARDGKISFANSAAVRFLGLARDAIIGKKYRDLLPTEAVIALEGALARIFGSAVHVRQENKILDVWLETQLVPVVDAAGLVEGVLWVSQDITRRKTAEQELRAHHERTRKRTERSKSANAFDKSKLYALTGNDPVTLRKFIELTLLTGASMVDNVERSLAGNDLGKVVMLANGIRETALQLGATRLGETCAAIMIAAKENRVDACRQLTPRVRRESEGLFTALRAYRR